MTVTAHVDIMLSLKISFVSAGLSKSYVAGSYNSITQDKSFSPQHSQANIAKKVSQKTAPASPPRPIKLS